MEAAILGLQGAILAVLIWMVVTLGGVARAVKNHDRRINDSSSSMRTLQRNCPLLQTEISKKEEQ